MTDEKRQHELRQQLETFGDARKTWHWPEGEPDYVTALKLTPADVPQLLAVVREWVEREDWPEDENDISVFAPVHAWRALAQLEAAEAAPVLVGMLDAMDDQDDDWYLNEFPQAFGLIGPAALEPLERHLADAAHGEYTRICAADAMQEVAARHAEQRDRVVAALSRQLAQFADQSHVLNAFLVAALLKLRATESAAVIERAYAADAVEVDVTGNWDTVRKELGVPGTGLVPDKLAKRPLHAGWSWPKPDSAPPVPPPLHGRERRRAERKRERRNRKRGRRR